MNEQVLIIYNICLQINSVKHLKNIKYFADHIQDFYRQPRVGHCYSIEFMERILKYYVTFSKIYYCVYKYLKIIIIPHR